jgi:hypothetical protein
MGKGTCAWSRHASVYYLGGGRLVTSKNFVASQVSVVMHRPVMIAAVLAAMAVMPTAQAFVAPGSFVPGLSLRPSAVPVWDNLGRGR